MQKNTQVLKYYHLQFCLSKAVVLAAVLVVCVTGSVQNTEITEITMTANHTIIDSNCPILGGHAVGAIVESVAVGNFADILCRGYRYSTIQFSR